MNRMFLLSTLVAVAAVIGGAHDAQAGPRRRAEQHNQYVSQRMPWHGEYYHTASGYAVPLIVPPTARSSTEWSWGVAQSSVMPIYHQFRPGYPGDGVMADGDLRPTPPWPSHTRQFGVYYIRGPW
ncbi:MAG: hypothetical protein U0935_24785 [Pirellulales bacterium]